MLDLIRRIYTLLSRRARRRVLALSALMAVNTIMEMLGIGIVLPLIQILVDFERAQSIPYLGSIYHAWFEGRQEAFILFVATTVLLVFATKNLTLAGTIYLQNRVVMTEQALFARDLLTHYLLRPYVFHLEHNSAELIRNVQQLSLRLFAKGVLPVLQVALEATAAIGVLAVLLMVNVWATICTAAVMALSLLGLYRLVHSHMYRWGQRSIQLDGEILRTLQQALGAVKATKISGSYGFHRGLMETYGLARARVSSLSNTVPYLPRLFIEMVALVGVLFLVFVLMVVQESSPESVLPMLGLFAVGALRLMPALSKVVQNLALLRDNTSTVEVLYADLCEGMVMECPEGANPLTFEDRIELRSASFRYPSGQRSAVNDASLAIPAGTSAAFVGRSGSGKTTLVDVILGLLEPTEGSVRVDGVDIRGRESAWWPRIGYVPQDIYLLDSTIQGNIALGEADDAIDPDRVREAAALAQLDDYVAELPQGLETVVGERGAKLSGGQRQRIGIARALYRRPDVLVLDEATSALDVGTEAKISEAIRALSGRMTVIIVAHRLSIVRHCDRLYFMEHGRIVADGTYDDLLRDCAAFREMAVMAGLETPAEPPANHSVEAP